MKFSKELISVLKNFATINTGIYLVPGDRIMTRSGDGATYGEVSLQDGETIPFDVAIYDLNAFLSILSLSGEESNVTMPAADALKIKGQRSEIVWPACDPSAIVYPKKAIKFPPACVEFKFAADEYNQMMKISRGLGADTIAFTNKDDKIVVNVYNKTIDSRFEKPLACYEVADYDGGKNFNFIVNIVNMKLITADYDVKLWAKDHMFAARFESLAVNYVIAVEDESTHNF
jgi:hypothetical protein